MYYSKIYSCLPLTDVKQQSGRDKSETTPEPIAVASQSMDDATISLDVMTTNIPSSLPADDEEFNLHLSNATTECSVVSTGIATQDDMLEEVSVTFVECKHAGFLCTVPGSSGISDCNDQ